MKLKMKMMLALVAAAVSFAAPIQAQVQEFPSEPYDFIVAKLAAEDQRYDEALTLIDKVIAKNPVHYGATYQLAKTLDLMGQRDQATPLWRKVLAMATQYRDANTIQQAKDRLK